MFEVLEYITTDGEAPLSQWLQTLDRPVRARIRTRIDRVARGNLGDSKALGAGLYELRLDFGPGYRIYYGRQGQTVVVLLCGGDKASQQSDIAKARKYWAELGEKHGNSKLSRRFEGGA